MGKNPVSPTPAKQLALIGAIAGACPSALFGAVAATVLSRAFGLGLATIVAVMLVGGFIGMAVGGAATALAVVGYLQLINWLNGATQPAKVLDLASALGAVEGIIIGGIYGGFGGTMGGAVYGAGLGLIAAEFICAIRSSVRIGVRAIMLKAVVVVTAGLVVWLLAKRAAADEMLVRAGIGAFVLVVIAYGWRIFMNRRTRSGPAVCL